MNELTTFLIAFGTAQLSVVLGFALVFWVTSDLLIKWVRQLKGTERRRW